MDFVVGDRDGFADALVHGARLTLEAGTQHRERERGGFAAGGLPAHAVDDHEQAAGRVHVESILVVFALQPGVGAAGSPQGGRAQGDVVHGAAFRPAHTVKPATTASAASSTKRASSSRVITPPLPLDA